VLLVPSLHPSEFASPFTSEHLNRVHENLGWLILGPFSLSGDNAGRIVPASTIVDSIQALASAHRLRSDADPRTAKPNGQSLLLRDIRAQPRPAPPNPPMYVPWNADMQPGHYPAELDGEPPGIGLEDIQNAERPARVVRMEAGPVAPTHIGPDEKIFTSMNAEEQAREHVRTGGGGGEGAWSRRWYTTWI